jgi:hypothetical protein
VVEVNGRLILGQRYSFRLDIHTSSAQNRKLSKGDEQDYRYLPSSFQLLCIGVSYLKSSSGLTLI